MRALARLTVSVTAADVGVASGKHNTALQMSALSLPARDVQVLSPTHVRVLSDFSLRLPEGH